MKGKKDVIVSLFDLLHRVGKGQKHCGGDHSRPVWSGEGLLWQELNTVAIGLPCALAVNCSVLRAAAWLTVPCHGHDLRLNHCTAL